MRVVLQLSGHFLLLGLRTASPHGSTPSLARSSGGDRTTRGSASAPGKLSCREARVLRAEVLPHMGQTCPEVSTSTGFRSSKNRTGTTCLAQSGQLHVQLWAPDF